MKDGVLPSPFAALSFPNLEKDTHLPVKILKFGTPQTIAIIVLKIENFDVTLY